MDTCKPVRHCCPSTGDRNPDILLPFYVQRTAAGADGITYGSACLAACSHVAVADASGPCPEP